MQIVLFDDSVSEGIEEFFVQVAAEGVDQETLEVVAQATIEITDDESMCECPILYIHFVRRIANYFYFTLYLTESQ